MQNKKGLDSGIKRALEGSSGNDVSLPSKVDTVVSAVSEFWEKVGDREKPGKSVLGEEVVTLVEALCFLVSTQEFKEEQMVRNLIGETYRRIGKRRVKRVIYFLKK